MLLPSSAERGPAGFCLTKTELNISRKWIGPDGIRACRPSGISRDLRSDGEGVNASEFVSAEGMQTDASRGDDSCKVWLSEIDNCGQGFGKGPIRNPAFLSVYQPQRESSFQGAALLQWGNRKRSRCSWGPKHPHKLCNVADETNPLQVHSAEDPCVTMIISTAASSKPNNGVAGKRDHPCSLLAVVAAEHAEEESKREKRRRKSSDSKERPMEVPVESFKRASLQTSQQMHQQEGLPHQSMRSSSPVKKLSPDRHAAAPTDGIESGPARKAFGWGKVVIPLSRKEKTEDFLMFKSCMLPLRPKRRPRAVEKALVYCTPGNSLSDVSPSRYNVKEKKFLKGRPSGLKAIESMETDTE